jgi:transposase-like protein
MQKKQYTATFKAQVVQEALKETQTLSQLGAIHGVHPTVIADWKAVALKGLASLFENGHSELAAAKATHEKEVNDLYAEIGKLTTQLAWLKKKAGMHDE